MAVSSFNSSQPLLSISSNSKLPTTSMQSTSHTQRLLNILLSLMDILNQAGKALTEEPEKNSIENNNKDSDDSYSLQFNKTKSRSLTNDFQDMTKLLRVIELKAQLRKDISRISTLNDTNSELDPIEIKNMYQLLRNILRDVAADESDAFQKLYSQGKKLASEAVLISKPPLSPTAIESSASYDSYSCDSGSEPEFEHFQDVNSSRSLDNETLHRCPSSSMGQKSLKSYTFNSPQPQGGQSQNTVNSSLKNTFVNGRERLRLSNSSNMYSSPDLKREFSSTRLSDDFECLDLQERSSTSRDAQGFDNRIAKGQFALSVLVGDPHKVGSGYRSFTVYSCQARGADGKIYNIRKRYSDFGRLRDNLLRLYPQFKKHIPRMPSKKVVGKFEANFVETRRQGLEYFLSYVSLHPIVGCSPLIVRFFTRP